jgi:hypothetical protein
LVDSRYRTEFEAAYKDQITADIKELKYVGELEYNFDNLVAKVRDDRANQFAQALDQIDAVINRDPKIYQRQEMTRKLLYQELNRLKSRCKIEIDSRTRADDEI